MVGVTVRHSKVVKMDMVTRQDWLGCNPDHLAEFAKLRPDGHLPKRDLVAAWHQLPGDNPRYPGHLSRANPPACHGNVVDWIEENCGGA